MVIRRFHGRHAPALSVIKSENHCLLTTSDGFRWSDCMDTLCYAATRRSEFCFSSASRGLVGRGPGELFWNNLPSPTQLATAKPKKEKGPDVEPGEGAIWETHWPWWEDQGFYGESRVDYR